MLNLRESNFPIKMGNYEQKNMNQKEIKINLNEISTSKKNKNSIKNTEICDMLLSKNLNKDRTLQNTKLNKNFRNYNDKFQNTFHRKSVSNVNELKSIPKISI